MKKNVMKEFADSHRKEDGRVHLSIFVTDPQDLFARFSAGTALSSDFADYLANETSYVPNKEPLTFDFSFAEEDPEMFRRIQKTYQLYWGKERKNAINQRRKILVLTIICIVIAIILLAVYAWMSYINLSQVITQIPLISAWSFFGAGLSSITSDNLVQVWAQRRAKRMSKIKLVFHVRPKRKEEPAPVEEGPKLDPLDAEENLAILEAVAKGK